MAKRRHPITKYQSNMMFKNTASQNGVHPKNLRAEVMRGGIRL